MYKSVQKVISLKRHCKKQMQERTCAGAKLNENITVKTQVDHYGA